MEPIGGYFGLELRRGSHYHSDAIKLNTARNCFEYILRAKKYKKVYIPFYTCEVMLEPIHKLNIKYEFYCINNELDPVFNKKLGNTEAFLYTNYFGLKQSTVELLSEKIGRNLIIDNAQAFFSIPVKGIDTFYSARKYFGVSDGAYLYTDVFLDKELEHDYSFNRVSHLVKRIDCSAEKGYADFKKNDNDLINNQIRNMSKLTDAILCTIDYEMVKKQRRENYLMLEEKLDKQNRIHFQLGKYEVPMIYPFLADNKMLREKLISIKIFVATYWPNVFNWCDTNKTEYSIAKNLIPLPIDQRYNHEEMQFILKSVLQYV